MIDNRRNAESAARNRIAVVNGIYDKYPMGVPVKGGMVNIANDINSTVSVVNATVNALRAASVVDVNVTWEAKGRKSMLTLLKPREEAIKTVTSLNDNIDSTTNLKDRIMLVMTAHPQIETMQQLDLMLKKSYGGSSDGHNLTHLLYVLKKEGKITFNRTSNKDKIPYNIRLTLKRYNTTPESPVVAQEAPSSPAPVEVAPESTSPVAFPLIEAIVNRESALRQAAKFAEIAGADDIAISLLDRADTALTPLEVEIVALYKMCKE